MMILKRNVAPFIAALSLLFLSAGLMAQETAKQASPQFKVERVADDPLNAEIYTFPNGLKVYISVNKDEPRVQTQIAVRTGSKQDPSDATGLAHYLEHMLFKGNSKFGTKDWEKEKVLLDAISDLYEQHRNTEDLAERVAIYAQIDSLSGEAAKYAIANEYDKMIGSLGAQGTNAYTWHEQTVYINDIPSNELEKWAMIESERFSELVLRLFHTELEVVYEEFNRTQDSDYRRAHYAMMAELFKKHPYGTQTTIGTGEHLKNPSMVKIHKYFQERYQPNNMAVVLAGDVDTEKALDIIYKYFGSFPKGEVKDFDPPVEDKITSPIVKEVTGVQPAFVNIGYRLPGANSEEALKLRVMDGILSNGQAGLIDLNLVQEQKVLRAYSSPTILTDYSIMTFSGSPREGQSLDEVADLLRGELEKIKKGEFDAWMLEAVIKNMKLSELRRLESNRSRASKMVDAFVYQREWDDVVKEYDAMSRFTKQDIVDFANEWFGDNYVQINKETGPNMAVKVEKPIITPVEIDRESKSDFYTQWEKVESGRIEPVFLDFDEAINRQAFNDDITYYSVGNNQNELFSLNYVFDMGTDNDLELGLAIDYLPYLGTKDMTPVELQQELFRHGLDFSVYSSRDRVYVTLNGLNESLEEGTQLFENILANVEPDEEALNELIAGILKERQDALKNKSQILFSAMSNYAIYGPDNPTKHILSEAQLRAIRAEDLVEKIKNLTSYKHKIYYYGPLSADASMDVIKRHHEVPATLLDYPPAKEFPELPMDKNRVYFANYDMVQSEMLMTAKGPKFNAELAPEANLFNQYFGSGLSSIVFQEIRESKALAYSAYSFFATPSKKNHSHYIRAYIGAQVDKLPEATRAMQDLMNDMPHSELQFASARDAAMKQIETTRTRPSSIFWTYLRAKELGLDYDLNREVYASLKSMDFEKLRTFFNGNIKGKTYTYSVIGDKNLVDKEVLGKLGEYRELTLEELFGYPDKSEPASKPIKN